MLPREPITLQRVHDIGTATPRRPPHIDQRVSERVDQRVIVIGRWRDA